MKENYYLNELEIIKMNISSIYYYFIIVYVITVVNELNNYAAI